MSQASENIRLLLWRREVKRGSWAVQLARWLSCSQSRAEELLWGAELQSAELERLAQFADVSVARFSTSSLLTTATVDILVSNIRFLTEDMGYGRLKQLADHLKLHPTTITKWRRGESRPRKTHLDALHRYFGLPVGICLETDPIFLSPSPVDDHHMRAWLHEHIAELDSATMRRLFPALEILLKTRVASPDIRYHCSFAKLG